MERFKGTSPHRPLDDSPTQIRIVNLLPGEYGDPIECVLEHIDMDTTNDYEALSYCWGEATITKPILLDSKPYPVTTNLFDGLRRLRKSDGPRRLWIDSLCINQSDVAERSREIQKMWAIYKHSAHVIVWLGECIPWSETTVQDIFDYVTDLGQAREDLNLDHSIVVARYGHTELWRQHLRLNEFLRQRQWFKRTWVIQEIAVKAPFRDPKFCPTLLCGTVSLSLHYLAYMNIFWKGLPPEYNSLKILRICEPLEKQLDICKGFFLARLTKDFSIAQQLPIYLANGALVLRTTDPKDQIYGVLGLLQHNPLPAHLAPDYGKSLQQVLIEYAIYFLEETGCIDIIQHSSGNTPDLPSWVPDWKHKPGLTHIGTKETRSFSITDDQKYLRVDFVRLDVIEETKPDTANDIKPDDYLHFVRDYINSASKWLYSRELEDGHASLHDIRFLKRLILGYDYLMGRRQTSVWHQLIVDAGSSSPIGDEYAFQRKGSTQLSLPTNPGPINRSDLEAGVAEVWRSVAKTVRDRFIFVCASGSVGIIKQMDVRPQPGDVVGGIRGANCEFVLRPCSQRGHYRVIGQCHRSVRGKYFNIMDIAIKDLAEKSHCRLLEVFVNNSCEKVTLC